MNANMSSTISSSVRPLGILAALPEELGDLIAAMRAEGAVETVTLGRRDYHVGTVHGAACVITLARIGKVAAAATVSALIHVFGVAGIVFTGVAGGVGQLMHGALNHALAHASNGAFALIAETSLLHTLHEVGHAPSVQTTDR
jgi:hypothetical protein